VPKWAQGADDVQRLVDQRHLQRVITDPATVEALLAAAERHLGLARSGAQIDPEGAYSLAYDARASPPPPSSVTRVCGPPAPVGTSPLSTRCERSSPACPG
jgi:hypothetical protein